jgi:hypothetical protein
MDIEIVAAVVGVTRGDIGQRTAPAIEQQHQHFDHHRACRPGGDLETPQMRRHRHRDDAGDEKRPDQRMQQFDREQGRGGRHDPATSGDRPS